MDRWHGCSSKISPFKLYGSLAIATTREMKPATKMKTKTCLNLKAVIFHRTNDYVWACGAYIHVFFVGVVLLECIVSLARVRCSYDPMVHMVPCGDFYWLSSALSLERERFYLSWLHLLVIPSCFSKLYTHGHWHTMRHTHTIHNGAHIHDL